MAVTLKYCDRDDFLRLRREEAEAAEPKPEEPVEEEAVDDATLANEIAALRKELQDAIMRLKDDFRSYLSAVEDSLS